MSLRHHDRPPSTRPLGRSFSVRGLEGRGSIDTTGEELGEPLPALLSAPEWVEHPVLPTFDCPLIDREHSLHRLEP